MANSRTANNSQLKTGDSVDISSEDLTEVRCIVVGKTGSGKSSTINTIAGKPLFLAQSSANSITKECQSAVIDIDCTTCLFIVDTPGLYDTELKNEETLTEIGKVIGLTAPGFHAFIVVVTCGRFTEEEKNTIDMIGEKFGKELYERTVILCTRCDDLTREGVPFHEYLKHRTSHQFKELVRKCRGRVVGFSNYARGSEQKDQVKKLMNVLHDILSETRSYYTNEMYMAVEEILQKERQRRVEEEMAAQKIQKERDQQFKEELYQDVQEKVKKELLKEIEANEMYGKTYQAAVKEKTKLWCVIL